MHIVDTARLPWELVVPNTRGGDVWRKVILAAKGGKQVSYDIRFERFGEGDRGYNSIRHRHDFEQLRFAALGRMDLGFDVLEEGDVGYFPANAYYGPQKCEGALILVAQWGDRFVTKEESDAAVAELSKHGEFRDGIYHGVGEDDRPYNKDPLNAIWEQVFGEPYKPQKPRYRQPVLMTPSAFGWSEGDGVTRSHKLGVFTENGLAVESVQWHADGSLKVAAGDPRPAFLFTTKGSFTHDGQEFGPHTGVWAESGEGVTVGGVSGSELLMVRFPAPSSRITLGLS
ncbi:hypothetical protein [Nocardia miyunensis]|uniref:hypothetical protein n=1 Tax=Nocardia miyunensis TaxID=282684 RepID=UPI00082DEE0C|nr:hypothetical protein [Nocardia miyunensis]